MTCIFIKELNDFCRKYFVTGEVKLTQQDIFLAEHRYKQTLALLFENFMLYDKIALKIHGENIPLAFLINELSIKGLERLIEQGGLKFVLWTPMILHTQDVIPGLLPLAHGRLSSKIHTDPEESIDTGLTWLKKPLNKNQRILIKRITRDLYELPNEGLEKDSSEFIISAFNSNKLRTLGLDSTKLNIYGLDESHKSILNNCASNLLEYKFLISKNFISNIEYDFGYLFQDTAKKINQNGYKNVYSHIAKLENFPNLQEIYFKIDNPLKQLLALRNKKDIKKFRGWLQEITTNHDLNEISKMYIDSIANKKGFFETKKGRFTKSVTMTAIGSSLGGYIAGGSGAMIGAAAAKMSEPFIDMGLDLVDEFLISEVIKGWSPRTFFDELRSNLDK